MNPETEDNEKETRGGGLLEKAATRIGSVIGAVAASTGLAKHEANAARPQSQPRVIDGKFQKSNKNRLPRKQKKMVAKRAESAQTAH
jgi:hypothetical protein